MHKQPWMQAMHTEISSAAGQAMNSTWGLKGILHTPRRVLVTPLKLRFPFCFP